MLTKDQRISFSKALVSASSQVAGINLIKAQIASEQAKAAVFEGANATLWSQQNNLIEQYQKEWQYLSGQPKTFYSDSDVIAASMLSTGNYFYLGYVPAYVNFTVPYALGYGLGNQLQGTPLATIPTEATLIANINSAIAAFNGLANNAQPSHQVTGQYCTGADTSSLTNITGFSGVLNAVKTAVNDWKNYLASEQDALNNIILIETNPVRLGQATTALASVNPALSAANIWLGFFDTVAYTGGVISSGSFDALTPPTATLDPSSLAKFNPTNISALQSAIAARVPFIPTRLAQLNSTMGTYSQNLTTGSLSGGSGLYYQRALSLLLRIGLVGGSLIKVKGLATAQNAQNSQIAAINNQVAVYSSLLSCSGFAADATNTDQVNLLDTSLFSVNDTVYVVSDNAEELKLTITNIYDNKRVKLSQIIPNRYTTSDSSRLYKDIS